MKYPIARNSSDITHTLKGEMYGIFGYATSTKSAKRMLQPWYSTQPECKCGFTLIVELIDGDAIGNYYEKPYIQFAIAK